MLQKGIIKDIINTKFKVRLPIFETAGCPDEYIVEAPLSYQPGNIAGYSIGDVVIVDFLNNDISYPIVTGKFYKGKEENTNSYNYSQVLEVTDSVTLPTNTKIGDVSYTELINAVKAIKALANQSENNSITLDAISRMITNGEIVDIGMADFDTYTTSTINDILPIFGKDPIETNEVSTIIQTRTSSIATSEDIKNIFIKQDDTE